MSTYNFGRRFCWGEMYQYNQTFILPIDIVNVYHPIRNFIAGMLSDFEFDAGSTGVAASVADAGGGDITVTDVAHGLLAGEPVYLVNSTNYDQEYLIKSVTADTFTVTKPFVATRTFNWYQPSTLKALIAGTYLFQYNIAADSEGSAKNYKAEAVVGGSGITTHIDRSASERLFSTGADYGNLVGGSILTIAANDYVWMHTKCTTDTSDMNLRHANINLVRIG